MSHGGDEHFGPCMAAAGTLAICYSIFKRVMTCPPHRSRSIRLVPPGREAGDVSAHR